MSTTLQQMLVTPDKAAEFIKTGAMLAIAADEAVLASLPCGNWIGGTIPYFMGKNGGLTSRQHVFVTPIPRLIGCAEPRITYYDTASLSQVCVEAPDNGYSLIILPAFSEVHLDYAHHAAMYEDMFMKPLVGWISGIHLDDMGKRTPKVRDGRSTALLENAAVVIHVPLPLDMSAVVNIINLFSPGNGDTLEFDQTGFEASQCKVNGRPTSLAKYLAQVKHDNRLPLVADYSGAHINVSIKAIDAAHDRVEFYAPVFPRVPYKLAGSFPGDYQSAFVHAAEDLPAQAGFSCNCILNYLYSDLEGKHTGNVTGPMTFGEVAYVLLNQTMVHLTLEKH